MAISAKTKSLAIIGVIAVIVIGLFSLALIRPWHKTEVVQSTVKVGYLPIYVDLPLFVAQEQFLKKRGIQATLVRFETSKDMADALASGQIDAAASVATNSALAIETRDPGRFRIFLVDAETPKNPLSSLLVSSSSPVRSVLQLKGKVIGSFPGPTAKIYAPLALARLGLAKGEYSIQEIQAASHITALESGHIDALITYEPYATIAEAEYNARRVVPALIEANLMSPWQAGVWIIRSDFVRRSPEVANKLVYGIYEAVDYLRDHGPEGKQALRGFVDIKPLIAQRTPDIPFTKVSEADFVQLQKHADLLTKEGGLSRTVDVGSLVLNLPPER